MDPTVNTSTPSSGPLEAQSADAEAVEDYVNDVGQFEWLNDPSRGDLLAAVDSYCTTTTLLDSEAERFDLAAELDDDGSLSALAQWNLYASIWRHLPRHPEGDPQAEMELLGAIDRACSAGAANVPALHPVDYGTDRNKVLLMALHRANHRAREEGDLVDNINELAFQTVWMCRALDAFPDHDFVFERVNPPFGNGPDVGVLVAALGAHSGPEEEWPEEIESDGPPICPEYFEVGIYAIE